LTSRTTVTITALATSLVLTIAALAAVFVVGFGQTRTATPSAVEKVAKLQLEAISKEQRYAENRANVRAAIPAAEAYFADFGTYTGMTLAKLKAIDESVTLSGVWVLAPDDTVPALRDGMYCLAAGTESEPATYATYCGPGNGPID
jgi:hypothetical protein